MNWKRGFRRIYSVLFICWAIFWLVFPFSERNEIYGSQYGTNLIISNTCHDRAYDRASNQNSTEAAAKAYDVCEQELERRNQQAKRDILGKSAYVVVFGDYAWSWMLCIIFVPPIVLYGIIIGVVVLIKWLGAGFRSDKRVS